MTKSILEYFILVAVFVLVSFGFTSVREVSIHENLLVDGPLLAMVFPQEEIPVRPAPPMVGKSYMGFKEALGYRESRGNYFIVNDYGYMGKYQFGAATLRLFGVKSTAEFLNNPELQERVLKASLERNKWVLRKEIEKYTGKTVNGVLVTESGILAAAHLGGAGSVKSYLRSWGANGFKDANGTSIRFYMKKFGGYDLSSIAARKDAKL